MLWLRIALLAIIAFDIYGLLAQLYKLGKTQGRSEDIHSPALAAAFTSICMLIIIGILLATLYFGIPGIR